MPQGLVTKNYIRLDTAYRKGYTTASEQGSARSSKTYSNVQWLISMCENVPGMTASIVRKTMPAIKRSVYRDFVEIMNDWKLWSQGQMNKSEYIYTFPNGSWLEFFSCENEQKLRGPKRKILFVNEANELSPLEWQQLQMRTTLFSILDYNPSFNSEHWINAVNREPQTYHWISTYKDNPFLEQRVIDEIEKLQYSNKSLWQIYGLGQQAVIEGVVFTNVDYVDEVPSDVKKRFRGIDFGYENDPTAIVDVYFRGQDVWLDELCYKTHMLTTDIVNVFKANDPVIKTISESADPRLVQEIYRAGVNIHPVRKYPGSVQAGIQKMQEFRFHITKRSLNMKKEAENYTWAQDKEGAWLNQPIDAFNHCWDAIRYVFLMEVMGGVAKAPNISRLAALAGY